jgi:hypothetical protein
MTGLDEILESTIIGHLPGEADEDEELLAELLDELDTLSRGSGIDAALAIAACVLDRLFKGDLVAFRERSRTHQTFRALQNHDRLPLSRTALWYALAVREQYEQLPRDLAETLPLSHHKALLRVDSPAEKVALARRAQREGLSRRDLDRLVRTRAPKEVVRGPGRPPIPAVVKGLRKVAGAIDLATSEPLSDADVRRLDREGLSELLSGLEGHLRALEELRAELMELSRAR